jgi:hypothetical protein
MSYMSWADRAAENEDDEEEEDTWAEKTWPADHVMVLIDSRKPMFDPDRSGKVGGAHTRYMPGFLNYTGDEAQTIALRPSQPEPCFKRLRSLIECRLACIYRGYLKRAFRSMCRDLSLRPWS